MAGLKIRVTFVDGTTEDVQITPRIQIITEQALKGVGPQNTLLMMYRFAYEALRLAKKEPGGFEEWIDAKVLDVDDVSSEDEPSDPTPEGRPTTDS